MQKIIPYYQTDDSRCIATVGDKETNLNDCICDNCHEFAIALASKFNYRVGLITEKDEIGTYLVHAFSSYKDNQHTTYYVDARGQSDDFYFLESEFGVVEEGDIATFGEGVKVQYFTVPDAVAHLKGIGKYTDIDIVKEFYETIDEFEEYYKPQSLYKKDIMNKVNTVLYLLQHDHAYQDILLNNDSIYDADITVSGMNKLDLLTQYIAHLTQLSPLAYETNRATFRYENVLFKISVSDEEQFPHSYEFGLTTYLNKQGIGSLPRPYHYSKLLYVVEYGKPVTLTGELKEEGMNILEECKSCDVVIKSEEDIESCFGMTEYGQLIVRDVSKLQVYDEAYTYVQKEITKAK